MSSVSATKKVMLVTGANTGLGFQASLTLAKMDNIHVFVTGRNADRVHTAVDKIKAEASASSVVEAGVLDLGNLKAIQEFAMQLKARGLVIDAILCNGGLTLKEKAFTTDGYESIFGVNHLGHSTWSRCCVKSHDAL
ncbi:hypothetical protein Poli38472_004642 [Pythium oligandrum]|uniref:Uncharacterized protein n=1 Tax=Pythium oligandrum TaxID=41045 RepID=A0A8K1CBF1_PYTOL|nr:hypothetical protein Poli38472_004642 [Pythium oligandrum]|eukprot:TMW59573.1 hypothetical protein Poli38472_004642 [Pythium oligandrum]